MRALIQFLLDIIRNWPDGRVDVKTLPMNMPVTPPPAVLTSRERLLAEARKWLGKDASPDNQAPKDKACAETVVHIVQQVFPNFPDTLSTVELDYFLDESVHFMPTRLPKAGNIIVSPRKGTQLGHAGFFITEDTIASNNSKDGIFHLNYSLSEWANEMRDNRGLRIFIYEAV